MKKDKLYLFTFLSLLVVVYICGYFSMNYLVDLSTRQFLKIQIESSKREAKEMANLISFQAQQHNDKQLIINNVQKSIEKTDTQTGFICMFDHTGKEICHPNPEKIGRMTGPDESFISSIHNSSEAGPEDFYSYLKNKTEGGGLRNFNDPERESEIIYLHPVKNTDWIVASHANIKNINKQAGDLKFYFILVYLSTGLLIVILSFFMVRLFGSRYERKLEQKNETLFNEVLNLSKLNSDLAGYKTKINAFEKIESADVSASSKKRILTYLKNEIVSLEIENIAYIYMENTITYVKDINSKVSTSSSSLEEIYNELDSNVFFRANRQFIVSIKSIDKILKYGNNQLKIEVIPKSDAAIIISKNKAAEFKAWLNRQ
ncbi:hypothetical protein HNP37_002222 [Flavobacterium nitrogenifigens]|uniref:HTH LytTR-type domain-containing protein n=2 Tax=Flavobacterium TaxID=237 RepID=A0A7W7IX00_9FLAO|nr:MULTISPECIES: LytTR family transcriptional regulator [Flavobacterium]MBB4802149.1 hypothetical protein [Flavobacterium nitrogenifigens]MBB6387107.1 hypothetical protein [Flavobacterium notoginsengisoli]